ncbi:tail fiber assembly protein [Citrobacter koseri]|uniref:tail fiber assembly protein n=1 Tax=Citrobacter koseri TaxID=545 RepID=UPI000B5E534A|nr:tail fiber assembly protein [Citrobacter koseri]DAF34029.1 MAG TPA: tail fiber assembly protein [Caudoviricetes sp.]ASE83603.1 tail fiber assembly protein [Citrobacter koseri]MBJ8754144.1 tail fiber assembly protein [Citrobacter koseri]MBJ8792337.1 tail fiber assembly protein [Citrobacter koseri]MBJ8863387.1 tail fiber assembly protein [Citrobacter koseri]
MSNYVYSPSLNLFYDAELEEEYKDANAWPEDGIFVSDEVFLTFSGSAPEGKERVCGEDNLPAWRDIPPPTYEELVAEADADKQSRIDQANDYMNSKQWPGKAALGRLKGDDLVQYNAWLDYLDALEAVDTSNAPDIEWPISPDV